MSEKLIVITGNRGKTTLAYFLAQELSLHHRVALVCTNGVIPVLPTLLPEKRNTNANRSLGKLLSLPVVNQDDVFDNATMLNKKLILLSYGVGESHKSYPAIIKENLEAVFTQLLLSTDVVIVDTSTDRNEFDLYALSVPHAELCITTADLQGACYLRYWNSQGRQLLWPSSRAAAVQDALLSFKEEPLLFPYCKVLEGMYSGIDISEFVPDKRYMKVLRQIVGELL